jgi:hypothetical protein
MLARALYKKESRQNGNKNCDKKEPLRISVAVLLLPRQNDKI